jgi:hypothetical protein
MTLRDLGPQALVSRNICYKKNEFLIRSLGNLSSDRWTQSLYAPLKFLGELKKYNGNKIQHVGVSS